MQYISTSIGYCSPLLSLLGFQHFNCCIIDLLLSRLRKLLHAGLNEQKDHQSDSVLEQECEETLWLVLAGSAGRELAHSLVEGSSDLSGVEANDAGHPGQLTDGQGPVLVSKQVQTLYYQINLNDNVKCPTISNIFSLIEANKASFHLETFSLSQTTLEQVFLSFCENSNNKTV